MIPRYNCRSSNLRCGLCAGFTLLEVVAALAISAILIFLACAALQSIHAASQQTRCLAHLRVINQGTLAYAADHGGVLPSSADPPEQPGNTDGIWYHYRELIAPYCGGLGSRDLGKIFTCPADHNLAPDYPSYLLNGGNEFDARLPGIAGRRLSVINHPSRTVLVAEAGAFHPYSWHEPKSGGERTYDGARNVISFCDGHLGFLPIFRDPRHEYAAEADPPPQYCYQWSPD